MIRALVAFAVGLILGATGPYYSLIGGFSLVPWGPAGVALGYFSISKPQGAAIGALYGFVLSFAFMIAGYRGGAALLGRLPVFAILGAFGAICGMAASLSGVAFRYLVSRRTG